MSLVGLATERTTGLERYGIELLRALEVHAPDDIEVVPFVHPWAARRISGPAQVVPDRLPRPAAMEAWLPRALARTPVDLLHVASFAPPRMGTTPFVATVHDLAAWDVPEAQSRGNRWYFRPALEHALRSGRLRAVVSHAQCTADAVVRRWHLDVPAVGVPIGLADEWFPPLPTARASGPVRLLSVGTLEPRKGLHVVEAAVAALARLGVDFEWRLVGRSGWGDTSPPRGVTVLGAVDDDELRRQYLWCDALVAPSLAEGFNLPVAEALAAGAAVLASDIPVHGELFGPAVTLTPPGDADALVAAIVASQGATTLDEPGARLTRQTFARSFDWHRAVDALAETWRQTAGRAR